MKKIDRCLNRRTYDVRTYVFRLRMTVDGKTKLRIPPGTQSGQKIRLSGKGIPSVRNKEIKGDQFVEVKITLPNVISEETKELLRKFEKVNPENPRKAMGLE